jgi:transposase
METFTMSRKELLRAGLVRAALAGRITNRQGAKSLRLSVRQFQRLKRRLETGGAAALRHQSRGQPSAHRLPAALRTKVTTLMTTVYEGFNDVHLTEKLREVEHLSLSRESVRRLRLAAGRPAQRPRRAPRYRRRRTPAAAAGALVQTDGSPFDWLEDRGPRLTLLGVIDDATGQILALTFREAEDLHGYTGLFHEVFTLHGLPLAVYGDRLNVFVRNDRHWTLEEQLAGERHPTHLGRMFQDLGISYISAHSPQAKGRIERLWATLQDRLPSELRLRGIKTPAAAEAYLPEFIADFNPRFAHPPATPPAVWRRPPRDLALVLSCRYTRVVARDHTIRLGDRRVQLPSRAHGRGYAGLRVEVRELLEGRLVILHDGRVLATQPSPGPDFVLTPRRSPSSERQGRRQRQATAMREALTDLARAEKQRPAGLTTDVTPAAARAEPAGGATTHDREGGGYVDTPPRTRNSPRARWRPAPSHPWRRAATWAIAAKNRRTPIPPGG